MPASSVIAPIADSVNLTAPGTLTCPGGQTGAACPLNYIADIALVGNGQGAFTELSRFGKPNGGLGPDNRLGAYIGDSWKVKPNLTVDVRRAIRPRHGAHRQRFGSSRGSERSISGRWQHSESAEQELRPAGRHRLGSQGRWQDGVPRRSRNLLRQHRVQRHSVRSLAAACRTERSTSYRMLVLSDRAALCLEMAARTSSGTRLRLPGASHATRQSARRWGPVPVRAQALRLQPASVTSRPSIRRLMPAAVPMERLFRQESQTAACSPPVCSPPPTSRHDRSK